MSTYLIHRSEMNKRDSRIVDTETERGIEVSLDPETSFWTPLCFGVPVGTERYRTAHEATLAALAHQGRNRMSGQVTLRNGRLFERKPRGTKATQMRYPHFVVEAFIPDDVGWQVVGINSTKAGCFAIIAKWLPKGVATRIKQTAPFGKQHVIHMNIPATTDVQYRTALLTQRGEEW